MSLTGYLSEYSLGEIFNFVQEGNHTGVLSIESDCDLNRGHSHSDSKSICDFYEIVFQGGRIMSVATRGLDRQTLLQTIESRQWLSTADITKLKMQLSSLKQPLGTYLKSLNVINTEQLIFIFNSQVIANLCKMFVEVHRGRFKFDTHAPLAYREMTGLSLTAKQATLMGLRLMKDWSDLTAKLPAAESTLQRLSVEPVGVSLERTESEVWKLAVGEMSISKIAKNLGLETSRVQQIGFRLSIIGLVHEVAAPRSIDGAISNFHDLSISPKLTLAGDRHAAVSTSFLSNLMSFLKKKG
ncbi:DUF4388 domain-containing protein [Chamaesiphon minutus]|uniref:PatA-like N-terminal domain-containing protein n=1 Tax=Chamaesiphon minutus (strain ATCC 27169 / PCC 6605) TaxID=1173020 RepID=K9UGT0_CHAP6|nr:DUF4388 domain-containing protein [Chamaesiphon minutus]AFY93646.1 hypothetical protein Cha6605_2599 [Chamaesiphon minutus PCC 6605]